MTIFEKKLERPETMDIRFQFFFFGGTTFARLPSLQWFSREVRILAQEGTESRSGERKKRTPGKPTICVVRSARDVQGKGLCSSCNW